MPQSTTNFAAVFTARGISNFTTVCSAIQTADNAPEQATQWSTIKFAISLTEWTTSIKTNEQTKRPAQLPAQCAAFGISIWSAVAASDKAANYSTK